MDCTYNCILRVRYANPILKLKQPATNSIKINGQKSFRKEQRGQRSRDAGDVPLPSPSYQQYIMLWNCTKDCN